MRTYTVQITDDVLADDFEAGLTDAGLDPQTLMEKEVGDFARAARQAVADAQTPSIVEPDVSTVDVVIT